MLDSVLHLGLAHPNALWILVPSLLSFVTGLGLGIRSGRLQALLGAGNSEVSN